MNKLIIFLLLVSIGGCKNNPANTVATDRALIPAKGNHELYLDTALIQVDSGQDLRFYYIDSFEMGHPLFAHNCKIAIPLSRFRWIICADGYQTPYLIFPNDTLRSTKDQYGNLILQSSDTIKNNELQFFPFLINSLGILRKDFSLNPNTKELKSLNDFNTEVKKINELTNQRQNILYDYSKTKKVSSEFLYNAAVLINHSGLNDFIFLCNRNKILLRKYSLFDKFIDSCITVLNTNTSQIDYSFQDAAIVLINIKLQNKSLIDLNVSTSDILRKSINTIACEFHNNAKDFLLSAYLFSAIKRCPKIPNTVCKTFFDQCNDDHSKEKIAKLLKEKGYKEVYKGKNIISSRSGTFLNFDSFLLQQKGKIILIDFWASWCAPCRAEMPFSVNLKNEFKNKSVAFVYLSIDESREDWMNASVEENLDPNSSFLVLDPGASDFINSYQIKTIPRYILINKSGKIITKDAPRPSDPALKKLITNNL